MKRLIALIIACVMVMSCLCACSKGPVSSEKENTHNAEEKTGDKTDEALAEKMQPNKYSNVKRLVSAHDDVIIFKQREAYGLMSLDGEIICSNIMGIKESANFEFDNNYMLGFYGDEGYSSDVQTVIDKKGNTVLSVGKDNVEFISKIKQGRIFVHQMTGTTLSGKTYDVICYSAKDMSEVFRLSDHNTISIYASFAVDGYSINLRNSSGHDVVIDIYGNEYPFMFDLPEVEGLEPSVYINDWIKLAELYDEYKNAPDDTRKIDVGKMPNELGPVATLYANDTSEWCATMDESGNILMPATKDVMLRYCDTYGNPILYTFSHDLCCAYSTQEQKWGYIDPYGNWKIEPQYDSVNTFSYDGYAVVDQYKVINTQGETVLDISKARD